MAVSNASPLIYLAKINALKFLFKIFSPIYIPEKVFEEITIGKNCFKEEVSLIEKHIGKEIIVEKLDEEGLVIKNDIKNVVGGLHEGELDVLALAKQERINIVLVDDKRAFKAAEFLNLTPVRTTVILLKALERKIINYETFQKTLRKLIREGYWITADIYEDILEQARKYTSQVSKS